MSHIDTKNLADLVDLLGTREERRKSFSAGERPLLNACLRVGLSEDDRAQVCACALEEQADLEAGGADGLTCAKAMQAWITFVQSEEVRRYLV